MLLFSLSTPNPKAMTTTANAAAVVPQQPNTVYNPATNQIIDIIMTDGRTLYGKQTVEEVRAEYGPQVEALDIDEAIERQANGHKQPAREITAEQYDDALNCMYPGDWVQENGRASFYFAELYSGSVTDLFVKIGQRYFTLRDSLALPHEQRLAACKHLLA